MLSRNTLKYIVLGVALLTAQMAYWYMTAALTPTSDWTVFLIEKKEDLGHEQLPDTFDYDTISDAPATDVTSCQKFATQKLKEKNSRDSRPDFQYKGFYCGYKCIESDAAVKADVESGFVSPGNAWSLNEYHCETLYTGK